MDKYFKILFAIWASIFVLACIFVFFYMIYMVFFS